MHESDPEVIRLREKRAAEMMLKGGYPPEVTEKMVTAYATNDYQSVQKLAAEYDLQQREELDSKIIQIPNPNFKRNVELAGINEEVKNRFFQRQSLTPAELAHEASEEQERCESDNVMHKWEEQCEPPFLFKVEGFDETFKSASKAMAAYKDKHGLDKGKEKRQKHQFKRKLKFVDKAKLS